MVLQLGFAIGALIEHRDRVAVVAAGAALVVPIIALVAPRGTGTGVRLDVAAVQGGGEQGTSALDVDSSVVTARHLEATRTIAPDESLDLVLWPENVIDVEDFATSDELAAVAAEARRASACRSPSASPRTCPAGPVGSPTPRSSSRPRAR